MRGAIVLREGVRLESDLIPDTAASQVLAGLRVWLSREIDLMPFALVPEGSEGVVVAVDEVSGAVEVELDTIIPGLRAWFNTITLMPFDTDDILDAFQVIAGLVLEPDELALVA